MKGVFYKNISAGFVSWQADSNEKYLNGVIFTAVFTVKNDAAVGKTDVRIVLPNEFEDVLDFDGNDIIPTLTSGTVEIYKKILYGDVNGDGSVNNADLLSLTRSLAGWNGYEAYSLSAAADVNRDGKVTLRDRAILARYIACWDGYAQYFEQP